MNTRALSRFSALAPVLLFAACTGEAAEVEAADAEVTGVETADVEAAEAEADGHANHVAEWPGALTGVGPWTETATDGSHVTLTVSGPVVPGPLMLSAAVHAVDRMGKARSVDLVSPTMPMHGLVRYLMEDGAVEIDIPMAGRWVVYVNLDDAGETNARFFFDVQPGEAGGQMHHGGDRAP